MEIGPGQACLVDLSAATFIDSSILTVLVQAGSRDGASATTLVVAPPGGAAARVLEITQASIILNMCRSMDEALESVMISE